jgi:phage tail P2-like protein
MAASVNSPLAAGTREVVDEPFGVGDGARTMFPLLYRERVVSQIGGCDHIYQADWQGQQQLSRHPRTNLLYPSTPGAGWGNNNASAYTTTRNLPDPSGASNAVCLTYITAATNAGLYYNRAGSNIAGNTYTFSVWLRGERGGEIVRLTVESSNVTSHYLHLTTQWQRYSVTYTKTATAGAVVLYGAGANDIVTPVPVGTVFYVFGAMLEVGVSQPGAFIATSTTPVTITDYTIDADHVVTFGQAPVLGARLSWSGVLVYEVRDTLLPPNATQAERAIEAVPARIDDIPTAFRDLWNPWTCPVNLLPWLAWAVSVDSWDAAWPEHTKRARIASTIDIQRHKGTVGSIQDVVAAFGGRVEMTEWWEMEPPGEPHTFALQLTLSQGGVDDSAKYVDDVIAAIWRTKPVRSHFTFTQSVTLGAQVGVATVLRPLVFARMVLQADAEAA